MDSGLQSHARVVLVHGFMQDARTWDALRSFLPEDVQVIAPTLDPVDPGHATLDDLAAQLRLVVGDSVPAVFVGYSMGGRIMQAYARHYPETLRALVLESAGLGPESDEEREAFAQRNAEWVQRFDKAQDMGQIVDWWESLPLFSTQKSMNADARRQSRSMRMQCNPKHLAWVTKSAGVHTMPLATQARTMLDALPCSVHYLYGRNDSKYKRVAHTLDSTKVFLQSFDAGHNVHMEQPREFADALMRIVRQSFETQ